MWADFCDGNKQTTVQDIGTLIHVLCAMLQSTCDVSGAHVTHCSRSLEILGHGVLVALLNNLE